MWNKTSKPVELERSARICLMSQKLYGQCKNDDEKGWYNMVTKDIVQSY